MHEKKSNHQKAKGLVWIYREGKGDYGFVDTERNGEKKGYYVHNTKKWEALDGDEVMFFVKVFKGKEEAEVTRVVKRAERIFVGEIQFTKKTFWFFIPSSSLLKTDVFIGERNTLGARHGDKVAVKIISWKWKNPEGQIIEILGSGNEPWIDVMALALEWGARTRFPNEVVKEAEKVSEEKTPLDKGRKDLTKLFTFTIDGEDAKDLDDAISIEKFENGNYKLFVHIADVTHYVKENSFLDREALKRGTSIYLADRVIPMLPEALSNGVCSLNALEEKLTLTCEMDVAQNGKIIGSRVYESLIKSNYRLTYSWVQNLFSWKETTKDDTLLESIKNAYDLKRKIEAYRKKNGYLEFDFDEPKIKVDEKWNPIEIKKYEKQESNKVIEHFMISANEAVSKKFSKVPFLYRIHPNPDGEDVEKVVKTIKNYFPLVGNNLNFEAVLKQVSGNNALSRLLLRALPKAIYSERNEGHFGLGLEFYSHFTSPIRRYPDLQIHRIIKQKLSGKLDMGKIISYKKSLREVAKLTSELERKAEEIERKVDDLMKMKYMKNHIGEEFVGTISGAIAKGIFVELENTVEGFIPLDSLQTKLGSKKKGSYFEFFEESLTFINRATGLSLRFGDTLKIKVIGVDETYLRTEFEFIEKKS